MALGRAIRAVLSFVLWTAAVIVGVVSAAAFVGGGAECVRRGTTSCDNPAELPLVAGILAAVALGVIAAVIWKPRAKSRKPHRPWEYLD